MAAALALGPAVDAADAQVFVDPDSPTAKEYAIPLEDARRDAAPGGNDAPVVQGERSAPIFGAGVGDDDAGEGDVTPAAENTPGSSSRPTSDDAPAGDGQPQGESVTTLPQARPITATVPQSGFGDTATIGALALSVLLLGGVIGSIARRRTL